MTFAIRMCSTRISHIVISGLRKATKGKVARRPALLDYDISVERRSPLRGVAAKARVWLIDSK